MFAKCAEGRSRNVKLRIFGNVHERVRLMRGALLVGDSTRGKNGSRMRCAFRRGVVARDSE